MIVNCDRKQSKLYNCVDGGISIAKLIMYLTIYSSRVDNMAPTRPISLINWSFDKKFNKVIDSRLITFIKVEDWWRFYLVKGWQYNSIFYCTTNHLNRKKRRFLLFCIFKCVCNAYSSKIKHMSIYFGPQLPGFDATMPTIFFVNYINFLTAPKISISSCLN